MTITLVKMWIFVIKFNKNKDGHSTYLKTLGSLQTHSTENGSSDF